MLIIRLAYRNLFRNARRTLLTILLISLSLTAMMLTDAFIRGSIVLMTETVTKTFGGEAQIHRAGFLETFDSDLVLTGAARLVEDVRQIDTIAAAAPRIVSGGMVSSPYNVTSAQIVGIEADAERQVSRVSTLIVEGSYLSGSEGEILIGRELANQLEVTLGDRIVITVAEVHSGELAQALYRLSGVFEFGVAEMDEAMVFINLTDARRLLQLHDGAHQVVIQFSHPDLATDLDHPLYALGDDTMEVVNWLDSNPEIASMLSMTSYSSAIIGMILFLLASLGVINSMFMSIFERIYELGVMKAVGTRPFGVMSLVAWEAVLIAAASATAGVGLGLVLGYGFSIYGIPIGEFEVAGISMDRIYTVLDSSQFVDFPIYVIILTFLASLYPAHFASRIVPALAIKKTL